jgi:hypothetical protein
MMNEYTPLSGIIVRDISFFPFNVAPLSTGTEPSNGPLGFLRQQDTSVPSLLWLGEYFPEHCGISKSKY